MARYLSGARANRTEMQQRIVEDRERIAQAMSLALDTAPHEK
jgi:hypothetical protein